MIKTVTVTSNVPYSISGVGTGDWCSINGTSGSAGTTVFGVIVTDNYSTQSREANIIFTSNTQPSVSKTLRVVQEGMSYSNTKFIPKSRQFNAVGESVDGYNTLDIKANADWQISQDAASGFIHPSVGSGYGNTTITLSVDTNPGEYREGILQLATETGGVVDTAIISQLAASGYQGVLQGMNSFSTPSPTPPTPTPYSDFLGSNTTVIKDPGSRLSLVTIVDPDEHDQHTGFHYHPGVSKNVSLYLTAGSTDQIWNGRIVTAQVKAHIMSSSGQMLQENVINELIQWADGGDPENPTAVWSKNYDNIDLTLGGVWPGGELWFEVGGWVTLASGSTTYMNVTASITAEN